jgi:phage terminase Nu1 subunit (DNA packaging protein)
MPQLVSFEQIAQLLDIGAQSVNGLVKKGMPREARGQYDVGRCFHWYVRYLHVQMRGKGGTEKDGEANTNLRAERMRLLKAQADLSELDLQERRGKIIPISLYEKLLIGWAVTIRQRVLALPARVATLLVGLDRRRIHDVLERECRELLLILQREAHGDRNSTAGTTDGPVARGRKDKRVFSGARVP